MAVGASTDVVTEAIASVAPGEVYVACVNSPQSVTVSGEVDGVDKLLEALQSKGMIARKPKVDTAYHSPHMQMVAEDYYEAISDTSPRDTSSAKHEVRMYSSVTGSVVQESVSWGRLTGSEIWSRGSNSPWVADHKIQGTTLYPAAGFIAMAVEAMLASHTDSLKKVKMFRLREVNFIAALVVSPYSAVEYTWEFSLKQSRTALRGASGK